MAQITLPHNFAPRFYQESVLAAMDGGCTRGVMCWHRRAGKEKTGINFTAKKTAERIGTYYYCFPTYAQGKKAIWEGRDRNGFKFLDHFPAGYVKSRNETDLKLHLSNGSIFQIIGTDNYDSVMSTNPLGIVLAEYSLQDPRAWEHFRPILRENGGWALFDFTPRGKNHAYTLFQLASKLQADGDPNWFCERLTVEDTKALSMADIEAERREGMDEEMVQQEYYCSFEGVQVGSYFGHELAQAEREGRITKVRYQPELGVETWWDLGVDNMAVWLTQTVGREIHVIDFMDAIGEGLPAYAKALRDKGYIYTSHNAPHDIKAREVGSGKSRQETARALGIEFKLVPDLGLADGIDSAKSFLRRCWFDRDLTERGRLALAGYHKVYDDKRQMFLAQPHKDWTNHAADAFRYLAVGHRYADPPRERGRHTSLLRPGSENAAWMAS